MPAVSLVVFAYALIFTALTPPEVLAPSASLAPPVAQTAPDRSLDADRPLALKVPVPSAATPAPAVATAEDNTTHAPTIELGSRPGSAALSYLGTCPTVIEGHTFRGLGSGVIAIRLEGCSNVLIRDNDFIDVAEGIYVLGGRNISVIGNRFQNILGPSARDGGIHGNFVQFDKVWGGLIAQNEGRCGDTEDTISVYQSSHVIVSSNFLEGTFEDAPGCLAWRSPSGTGINVNDGGGTGNIVRHNVLVNPHRVGIGVAGGTDTQIDDNVVYSARRQDPNTAVGIAVENYSGAPCTGITIEGNHIRWVASGGYAYSVWHSVACGTVADRGSRRYDRAVDPAKMLDEFRKSIGSDEGAVDPSLGLGGA
jgi:parallel beta-helix repeat protein